VSINSDMISAHIDAMTNLHIGLSTEV
ncbi:uncharacterized protein METZ01_LOCUS304686, partial [marine metagenome]